MFVGQCNIKNSNKHVYYSIAPIGNFTEVKTRKSEVLHPNEILYYDSLKSEIRQKSYLMGRYTSKKALSAYLQELDLTSIEIIQGVFGQPIVHYLTRETPDISISHDNCFAAAVAFPSSYPIAIDIETIEYDKVETIKSLLTKHEIQFATCSTVPFHQICAVFWTAKEALGKVIKCGITLSFDFLETMIEKEEKFFKIKYKNFPQYQARAWLISNQAMTIVYPVVSDIDFSQVTEYTSSL